LFWHFRDGKVTSSCLVTSLLSLFSRELGAKTFWPSPPLIAPTNFIRFLFHLRKNFPANIRPKHHKRVRTVNTHRACSKNEKLQTEFVFYSSTYCVCAFLLHSVLFGLIISHIAREKRRILYAEKENLFRKICSHFHPHTQTHLQAHVRHFISFIKTYDFHFGHNFWCSVSDRARVRYCRQPGHSLA
jgi:hypothetical protein